MEIREIAEGDYDSLYLKIRDLYKEHSLLRPDYYDEIESINLSELLNASNLKSIATDGGEIIGFVRGEVVGTKNKFAVVHDIFIDPLQRGKGVGSMLMNDFYTKAKAAGAHSVRLQVDVRNAAAVSFWEKEGFETTHLKMSREIS